MHSRSNVAPASTWHIAFIGIPSTGTEDAPQTGARVSRDPGKADEAPGGDACRGSIKYRGGGLFLSSNVTPFL